MASKVFRRGMAVFAIFALVLISSAQGKVLTKCQLATALLKTYGIPKRQLADWICLATAESGLNTGAVGATNSNGSKDYGIFQINSFYWCSGGVGSKYNECKVPCSSLTNDDISDDVKCAKLIFSRQGFPAWYGWQYKCKGKNLSAYLAGCAL